jgi:hypothetical protein
MILQKGERMSVEASFTVMFEGEPYQVEVSYNRGKSIAGVENLIVNDLVRNLVMIW